jgi:hypothetical protein
MRTLFCVCQAFHFVNRFTGPPSSQVSVRTCCDSSTCLTDRCHFVIMPETHRLARIIQDGSWRNRAVAKRDRRAEP